MIYSIFSIDSAIAGGTDAVVKLGSTVALNFDLIGDTEDRVELVVSDDLSGLTDFRGLIRGDFLEL